MGNANRKREHRKYTGKISNPIDVALGLDTFKTMVRTTTVTCQHCIYICEK